MISDETGILVPPSIDDIARAITELAEDTHTRSVLAAGASAHARALSWERCAAKTYGLPRPGEKTIDAVPGRVADAIESSASPA